MATSSGENGGPSLAFSAPSTDGGSADRYRPPCTVSNGEPCQINDYLSTFNMMLFNIGMQLQELPGGWLSLVILSSRGPKIKDPSESELHRAREFLRWLLKGHACITSLDIREATVVKRIEIVLQAMREEFKPSALKMALHGETVLAHITRLLPRFEKVEELHCHYIGYSDTTDAFVTALSALLETTTCLRSLTFHGFFLRDRTLKIFTDAVAANTTLKSLDVGDSEVYRVRRNRVLRNAEADAVSMRLMRGPRPCRDHYSGRFFEEAVLSNTVLSSLTVLQIRGGERSVHRLTNIIAGCNALIKITISTTLHKSCHITKEAFTRFSEALADNNTLEELKLSYHLWQPEYWITFFTFLPRNERLKILDVSDHSIPDYGSFPALFEALAKTETSVRVSFGNYTHVPEADLMHFKGFSGIFICSDEIPALQRLPKLNHITSVSLLLGDTSSSLFPHLKTYIAGTTVLRELRFIVINSCAPTTDGSAECWRLLFESISVCSSLAQLEFNVTSLRDDGCKDLLAHTISGSTSITRVTVHLFPLDRDSIRFVLLLSKEIQENYTLLDLQLGHASLTSEATHSWLAIMETTRRNSGFVARAATFLQTSRLDRYNAVALEQVLRNPALVRELAERECIAQDEVATTIRNGLLSVDGLHDFMRLTGVVKQTVTCAPSGDGCSTTLLDLNVDCWRCVRRHLSFDDVKSSPVANDDSEVAVLDV